MMDDIEWEAETILRPDRRSLQAFCTEKGISVPTVSAGLPFVFISTHALDDLLAFLASDTGREHGGVLAGLPFIDEGLEIEFVDVQAALPALDSQGSAVHLQFTGPDWAFISGMLAEEYPGRAVVGWFHSHPALGVFMSATDAATQRAFFNQSWHLALVVDPLARISAWFCGADSAPLPPQRILVYPKESAGQKQIRRTVPGWSWLLPLTALFLAGIALGWLLLGSRRTG
jgi:proteasome lid subunit RPN8/RPN11